MAAALMSGGSASEALDGVSGVTSGGVLAGKYRVERVLGRGGMGVVVEARHLALDERVALKFLLPQYTSHPEAAERFLREARAAVKIKTEHVARVSDVGTLETGAPYMVMEFLEGSDLARLVQARGGLPVVDAIDYILQGSEAIAEAHSYGIVHRDLKPANLFLTKRPDGTPLVKVLDFGISKNLNAGVDSLTRTSAAMGSALYMSPEQMQQARSVDHRTDIYALGVALFELLTATYPFLAETMPELCARVLTGEPTPLRSLRPDVSEDLAAIVAKAYARDRAQRFQSVAELAAALAPYAPQRSQATVDRIARMAGLEPPIVGRASSPPVEPPWPQASSAQGASPPAAAQTMSARGVSSWSAGSSAPAGTSTQGLADPAAAPPSTSIHESSGQILVPGYAGPVSVGARAAFAARARMPPGGSSSGRAFVVAFLVAGVLAIIGVLAVVALRRSASSLPPQPASETTDVSPSPARAAPERPVIVDPSSTSTAAPLAPSVSASSASASSARGVALPLDAAPLLSAAPSVGVGVSVGGRLTPSSKPTSAPTTRATGTRTNAPPPIETSR